MERAFRESPVISADAAASAIIATILNDRNAAETAIEMLTPDDFRAAAMTGDEKAAVFEAVISLVNKGKTPAPILVASEMGRLNLTPKDSRGRPMDVTQSLVETAAHPVSASSVAEYIRILKRYGVRRQIQQAGLKLLDLSAQDSMDTPEYVAQAEAIVQSHTAVDDRTQEPRRLGEVIRARLELHKARKPGQVGGLSTGFDDVDDVLRGMNPGDFIVIAGRPSMGKSAFAQGIAESVAKDGWSVYVVSLEMPDEQIADRAIASTGHVDSGILRTGEVMPRDWDTICGRLEKSGVMDARFFVDDRAQTVADIRMQARRIKRKHGLDLLIIDYLQLMRASDRYKGDKTREVGEISRSLKLLAKELGIPVIALSQLNRGVESRQDKRPALSDLRESGDIEQDADVVGFLYRDEYYNSNSADKGIAEFIIQKQRNGPVGTVRLAFFANRTKFANLEQRRG